MLRPAKAVMYRDTIESSTDDIPKLKHDQNLLLGFI